MVDVQIKKERSLLEQGGFDRGAVNKHLFEKYSPALREGGFTESDINDYIGKKSFDSGKIQTFFKETGENLIGLGREDVPSFKEYFEEGFQESVTGLALRQKLPEGDLPDDNPFVQSLARSAATLAGDIPAMVAGYMAGAPLGAAVGAPVGGPVGAAVGSQVVGVGTAFAFPAGLRTALMDGYKDGSIDNFQEFWTRVQNVGIESAKGFITGAVARGVGIGAGAVTTRVGGTLAQSEIAALSAEIPAMVSLGAALEGHVPRLEDFASATVLIFGARAVGHGVTKAQSKTSDTLMSVYEKTGKSPKEVVKDATVDLTIKEDIAAGVTPRAYERLKVKEQPAPEVKPVPEISPELTSARKAVGERISVGEKTKHKVTFNEVRRQFIDELAPLDKAIRELEGGKSLPAEANPVILARTAKSMGFSQHFWKYGTFDFKTAKNTGKSLEQVLKPVQKDIQGFREYITAKRALKINETRFKTVEGKEVPMETGVPLDAAQVVVKGATKEWKAAAKELSAYNRRALAYLRDGGVVSKESYDALLKLDDFYIPFNRVMEESVGAGRGGPGKDQLSVFNPLRGLKGSERKIIDPLESVVKNTHTYIQLAERNRTLLALADLAPRKNSPVKKIKPPFKITEVKTDELNRFFKDQKIKAPDDLTLDVFRPNRLALKDHQFVVFREGKPEYYETKPEIAQAMKEVSSVDHNALIEIMAVPAKLRRAGITMEASFQLTNFFRDNFVAGVQSKNGFVPFLSGLEGLSSILKQDKAYQDWVKSGGAQSALVSMDRQYLSNELYRVTREHPVRNAVHKPIEIMRAVMEASENATRVGEFKLARKKGKSLRQAGAESREVSVDFGRQPGSQTIKTLNRLNAFLNARIQGYDRLYRAFRDDPMKTSAKVTGMIVLPSLAVHASHYERDKKGKLRLKQWYKDLPDWQKDTSWILNVGTDADPTVVRLRKPFELGIFFGTGSEKFMDYMLDQNPDVFEALTRFVSGSLADPGVLIPDFAEPFVETAANKSLFTGAPLIPMSMESRLPEFQVKPYTSQLTKALGAAIATVPSLERTPLASPIILDNFIRSWAGTLGVQVRDVLDASLRKAGILAEPPPDPEKTLADIPIVKAFIVRNKGSGMQPVIDFYDQYAKNQSRLKTLTALRKQGNLDKFMEQRERAMLRGEMTNLVNFKNTMKSLSAAVYMIDQHPTMDPVEKRQLIDKYYAAILEVARKGNEFQERAAEKQKQLLLKSQSN